MAVQATVPAAPAVPAIRSRFSLGPRPQGMTNFPPSKTQQHQLQDVNINSIMERVLKTGVLPTVPAQVKAVYADVSKVGTYQDALKAIDEADVLFSSLPSSVRSRFQNSPSAFLSFIGDPKNQAEAVQMGLAVAAKPASPVAAPAAALAATPAPAPAAAAPLPSK